MIPQPPAPTDTLTPLALWQRAFTVLSARGYSHLDALEAIEARWPGLSVQAKAENAFQARQALPAVRR